MSNIQNEYICPHMAMLHPSKENKLKNPFYAV